MIFLLVVLILLFLCSFWIYIGERSPCGSGCLVLSVAYRASVEEGKDERLVVWGCDTVYTHAYTQEERQLVVFEPVGLLLSAW